jgi:tRNA uridine 5-carboxymethylaminomethyl modification enzyme
MLREDNADLRLMEFGHDLGLIDSDTIKDVKTRKNLIANEIERIKNTVIKPTEETNAFLSGKGTKPLTSGVYLDQLLKRAGLDYHTVAALAKSPVAISAKVAQQVEIEIKYEGYIKRQLSEIEKFKNFEKVRIPEDFNYLEVHGLSNELKEKLAAVKPASLGQASRIDGITPAGLSVLMVALRAAEK